MTCLGTTELSKRRRTEIHSQIYANDFCLRTRRESIKFQKFTRVPAARIYLCKREKEETLKKRSENRRVLSIRAHMYAESCGPSSPASAGFPRSFSRLDLSLLLFLFLLVFSLSWVLEVRTVITPHLPSRSSASCIHWPRLHTSSRGYGVPLRSSTIVSTFSDITLQFSLCQLSRNSLIILWIR